MRPFLSVVIPAYNESKRLPLTLINVDKNLSARDYSYEIIVVNDGSTDSTADIVTRFSKIIKNLRLIDNMENHGKGWVVRQGMLSARGSWRLFMDADNSTTIDQFDAMVPFFSAGGGSAFGEKESFDVVIGSRALKGSRLEPPQPIIKRLLGKFGNLIIQIIALKGFKDTQCGFKCFSEEATEAVFRRAKINRWGFDVEILLLAKMLGFTIKEIPVRWVNDARSSVGWRGYFSTLLDVVKIKIWVILKKYNQKEISL